MTGNESLIQSRVKQMVCPLCARMNGQEHVDGCPGSATFEDTGTPAYRAGYYEGWIRAKNGLLPPLADDLVSLREERDRARHLAMHLFLMIDRETWRATGGDDGQGHYEGDYRAAGIEEEIRSWQ